MLQITKKNQSTNVRELSFVGYDKWNEAKVTEKVEEKTRQEKWLKTASEKH
jgi:hypothetical protein